MVGGYGFAKYPWQKAQDEGEVGELEEATEFGVEAAVYGMHEQGSYSKLVVDAIPGEE
jgi:hypothetical protein